ncbi:sulfur carrier protein ThiS [Acinetobacter sp. A3.8]|uniref:Sulfur carrier protein ThiS n=1 Tax=Acinetobacter sedimenti TaxID=2919922 RepID=A0A9X2B8T2_9GAMM|nr:sulfur carrier protein ThiS [Acinetobacter sedimenti]MCJ8146424.1 sulfur carrier protein ThiS [Acinetobacter sedimenti]
MNIFLNGEAQNIEFSTLFELVQSLQLDGKRFAVEVNEQIVPKSRLLETMIQNNDKIEIIQAVGGG